MTARCNRCLDTMEQPIRMWGTVDWCKQCALDHGGATGRRAVARCDLGDDPAAYTPEVLARLASGALMDPNALFLPAGKLSLAETLARESAGMERLA